MKRLKVLLGNKVRQGGQAKPSWHKEMSLIYSHHPCKAEWRKNTSSKNFIGNNSKFTFPNVGI